LTSFLLASFQNREPPCLNAMMSCISMRAKANCLAGRKAGLPVGLARRVLCRPHCYCTNFENASMAINGSQSLVYTRRLSSGLLEGLLGIAISSLTDLARSIWVYQSHCLLLCAAVARRSRRQRPVEEPWAWPIRCQRSALNLGGCRVRHGLRQLTGFRLANACTRRIRAPWGRKS
jgi:hypothetical protein